MTGLPPTAGVQVFPVEIGHYAKFSFLNVDAQVGQVLELLSPFGPQPDKWTADPRKRGADAVGQRLRKWADARDAADAPPRSLLYWAGHGWADAHQAALAHADSAERVGTLTGISPQQFADAIRLRQPLTFGDVDRQIEAEGGSWDLVVVDACRAKQFCRQLAADLENRQPEQRVLLIGASDDGSTSLGDFTNILRLVLKNTYKADRRISLDGLGSEFHDRCSEWAVHAFGDLTRSALVPVVPPAASLMSASLDDIKYVEQIVDELSPDERWHFFAKAQGDENKIQGAEHSEMSWFFEGREAERGEIVSWLRDADSGMLVVTGKAGSGKSALLGNVFVHSHPGLRAALVRRVLVPALSAQEKLPPDGVFDAVIHLSSLTLPQVISRLAAAAGLGSLPSHEAKGKAGTATDLDWLTERLRTRTEPLTILADALDEATDPLDTARSLLAGIAAVPGVRILVGTRRSSNETPDAEAADTNLLDALGVGPAADDDAAVRVISVGREREAIRRYVENRLRRGCAGDQDAAQIKRAAGQVADKEGAEFLFARLAVYELIASPGLLTDGRARARRELLAHNHRDLFRMALDRLDTAGDGDERYSLLLEALSLARGRGLPMADGIWAIIAMALDPEAGQRGLGAAGQAGEQSAMQELIDELLDRAAPYVIVDNQAADSPAGATGGTAAGAATVFRLAHRTFVENFSGDRDLHQDRQRRTAAALLDLADRFAADAPEKMPAYLARHLSGHIADADLWDELADRPWVLDGLDPGAVTADAMRTLFGRRAIPPAVAGIIGARDALASTGPADRAGLRQLATVRYSSRQVVDEASANWGIYAGQAGRAATHARLTGQAGVISVRSLALRDGRVVLAAGYDDSTIRLWDPLTATPVGSPLTGHEGTIMLSVLPARSGAALLASAADDATVRIWDPDTGRQVTALTGHSGTVFGMCTLAGWSPDGLADGRSLLATGTDDGIVRIWDPEAGEQVIDPPLDVSTYLYALCALPGWGAQGQPDGRTWLAVAGSDGVIRVWDPIARRQVGAPLASHTGNINVMCALTAWDGHGLPASGSFLATAGYDGTVWIWDPVAGRQIAEPLVGNAGPIWDMCTFPAYDAAARQRGSNLLATVGSGGMVRIWDPVDGREVAAPLAGHSGAVGGVCAVPGLMAENQSHARTLLATAGDDRTVRIWDPAANRQAEGHAADRIGMVGTVCTVPGWDSAGQSDGRTLLVSAGSGGIVRFWDPETGWQVTEPLSVNIGTVWSACALPGWGPDGRPDGRTFLAVGGDDGSVRIWDPVARREMTEPLTGHTGTIWQLSPLPSPAGDGRTLVASAGHDSIVRVWDPVTGRQGAEPMTGHTGVIWAMCAVPGWDAEGRRDGRVLVATGADDGPIRIRDPATGEQVVQLGNDEEGCSLEVCVLPSYDAHGKLDGRILLATISSYNAMLRVWDPSAGELIKEFATGHRGSANALCSLPGLTAGPAGGLALIATVGDDGTVRVWDPETGTQVTGPLTGHNSTIWNACTLPARSSGQTLLATAGDDGTARLWDPIAGRPVGEPLSGSPDAVSGLAACPAAIADCIAMTSDGTVRTWTAATAAFSPVASAANACAVTTAPVAGRNALITADITGSVHVTDLITGDVLRPPAHVGSRAVLALCPLPGEAVRIAAAGSDGAITVVAAIPGQDREQVSPAHEGPVRALCLIERPGGQPLLASAGNDGAIRTWDTRTWEQYGRPLTGHDGWIWSITPIPPTASSAAWLASAGADGTVRLWDPDGSGTPLEGHTDQVRAVTCVTSADGHTLLVSGSHDGTVRLWDPLTRAPVHAIALGIAVHQLLQQAPDPRSLERTGGGATVTVGLATGIAALDINSSLFSRRQSTRRRAR